jgi:hypothetical protein
MSIQKILPDFSIITSCPLIITPIETVLTYQTSSAIAVNHNVNGRSSNCYPNEYAYLEIKPIQKPVQCCTNNALKSFNKNIANIIN